MANKSTKEKGTQFGTLTPDGRIHNKMVISLNKINHKHLSKINSPDPLAYAYGKFQAMSGQPMSKDRNLASEYIRGYNEAKKKSKR